MKPTQVPYLRIATLAFSLLASCASGDAIAKAVTDVFGGVTLIFEAIAETPAELKAGVEVECDTDPICTPEGMLRATRCELDHPDWVSGFGEAYVGCLLEQTCDGPPGCVPKAIEAAHLQAPEDLVRRCTTAVEACAIETDACMALPALAQPVREALDLCHTVPCEDLAACYSHALLENHGLELHPGARQTNGD